MTLHPKISIIPFTDWLEPFKGENKYTCPEGQYNPGYYCVRVDNQIDLIDDSIVRYRVVYALLDENGVQEQSKKVINFNPHFQNVEIHALGVWRNGEYQDRLEDSTLRVIQRESDFERSIYDESLSIIAIVHDTQVDDCVEMAYSIFGINPTHEGKYSASYPLNWAVPVKKLTLRINHRLDRKINWQLINCSHPVLELMKDNLKTITLSLNDIPFLPYEKNMPKWFDPWQSFQITEYQSWQEVVEQGVKLFNVDYDRDKVVELVSSLALEQLEQEDKLTKILDYVQKKIRYQAIGYGEYQYQPHSPNIVLKNRFGDCKDKSLLLSKMLECVGIRSYPTLVNTYSPYSLSSKLPSHTIFDHAILKVELEKGDLFVDPTVSGQVGPVRERYSYIFQQGLVLKSGNNSLEVIPDLIHNPQVDAHYQYKINKYSEPMSLEIEISYQGYEADSRRDYFEVRPKEEIEIDMINYFSYYFKNIKAVNPIKYQSFDVENKVITKESYLISDYLEGSKKKQSVHVLADVILGRLPEAKDSNRRYPFNLIHPVSIKQTIMIEIPAFIDLNIDPFFIDNKLIRYSAKWSKPGPRFFQLEVEYQTKVNHVLPEDYLNFKNDLISIRNNTGIFWPANEGSTKLTTYLFISLYVFILFLCLFGIALQIVKGKGGGVAGLVVIIYFLGKHTFNLWKDARIKFGR